MGQIVKPLTISISERTGDVSALAMVPKNAAALLVLAHGAGAGMTHAFMEATAEELSKNQIATLRYNFPYMEKGSRRPDVPAVAEKTVAVVIEKAHELYPKLPLYAGGKSFGGRMTSQRISKECPKYLRGITFFGFPLHAIGNPGTERAAHLSDIEIPILFLQGTKDKLAEIDLIRKVTKGLKTATLKEFDGADHSFKVSKQNIIPELVDQVSAWIQKK